MTPAALTELRRLWIASEAAEIAWTKALRSSQSKAKHDAADAALDALRDHAIVCGWRRGLGLMLPWVEARLSTEQSNSEEAAA